MRKALLQDILCQTTYRSSARQQRSGLYLEKRIPPSEELPVHLTPTAAGATAAPAHLPEPQSTGRGKSLELSPSSPKPSLPSAAPTASAEFAALSLIVSFRNTLQNLEFAGPGLQMLFRITKAFQERAGWYSFATRRVEKSYLGILCSNSAQIPPGPRVLLQLQARPRHQKSLSDLSNPTGGAERSASASWVVFLQWRRHSHPRLYTREMYSVVFTPLT